MNYKWNVGICFRFFYFSCVCCILFFIISLKNVFVLLSSFLMKILNENFFSVDFLVIEIVVFVFVFVFCLLLFFVSFDFLCAFSLKWFFCLLVLIYTAIVYSNFSWLFLQPLPSNSLLFWFQKNHFRLVGTKRIIVLGFNAICSSVEYVLIKSWLEFKEIVMF